MSQPNDLAPAPPAATPEPTAPPLEAAPIEAAVPSGAPYRALAPPDLAAPEPWAGPTLRKPRTVVGPALSTFAVLLWSYVVFGQLTTSWLFGTPLNQGFAFFMVFVTTVIAWIAGIRRSRVALEPWSTGHLVWRSIGIAVVAWLAFLVCLSAASVFGALFRNHDVLIPFLLVVLSVLAAFAGAKVTSPLPITRTHRQRSVLVALWIAGLLLTLVAAGDLAANG